MPVVTLAEVTSANREACARLRVRPEQQRFVAEVAHYLCLCHDGGVWHPVAAYAGDAVVAFAMWGVDEDDGSHWIGGLVVDADSQGQGIGRQVVTRLVERLAPAAGPAGVALSYDPANTAARRLYASLGFVETGEREGDELVARVGRS